jgi:TPR repeat protein
MDFANQGYEYLYGGDFDKALECFRKGAEENDAESCWGIVELYESGKPKDQKARKEAEAEAIEMCIRAASLGHAKAEYKLSCMRKKDRPVEVTSLDDFRLNSQNRQEHADYVQKVEAGDLTAWEEVGMDYLLGLGVERDTDKAYECFQKGGAGAEAWEHIGGCYLHGVGCEKNVDRAVECYRRAANLGSAEAKAALRGVI